MRILASTPLNNSSSILTPVVRKSQPAHFASARENPYIVRQIGEVKINPALTLPTDQSYGLSSYDGKSRIVGLSAWNSIIQRPSDSTAWRKLEPSSAPLLNVPNGYLKHAVPDAMEKPSFFKIVEVSGTGVLLPAVVFEHERTGLIVGVHRAIGDSYQDQNALVVEVLAEPALNVPDIYLGTGGLDNQPQLAREWPHAIAGEGVHLSIGGAEYTIGFNKPNQGQFEVKKLGS